MSASFSVSLFSLMPALLVPALGLGASVFVLNYLWRSINNDSVTRAFFASAEYLPPEAFPSDSYSSLKFFCLRVFLYTALFFVAFYFFPGLLWAHRFLIVWLSVVFVWSVYCSGILYDDVVRSRERIDRSLKDPVLPTFSLHYLCAPHYVVALYCFLTLIFVLWKSGRF